MTSFYYFKSNLYDRLDFVLYKINTIHRMIIKGCFIFCLVFIYIFLTLHDQHHGHQKIAILIRIQFLNDIIKSRHGFKAAQKFHKFRIFIKTIKLLKFLSTMVSGTVYPCGQRL